MGSSWRVLTRQKRDFALPLVDCKWQSKFTLAVGAKMESDSFVREFERLSGRAGIGMIPSPFISKSPMFTRETSKKHSKNNNNKGKIKPAWHRFGMTSDFFSKHLSKMEQRNKKMSKESEKSRPKSERAGCRTDMSGDVSTLSKRHQYYGNNPSTQSHLSSCYPSL